MKTSTDVCVRDYTFYSKNWTKKDLKQIIDEPYGEAGMLISNRENISELKLSEEQKKQVEEADKRFAKKFDEELLEEFENEYPETEMRTWWGK